MRSKLSLNGIGEVIPASLININYGSKRAKVIMSEKTTKEMRLGHKIQAYAIEIGDEEVASIDATKLGKMGSYEDAKRKVILAKMIIDYEKEKRESQ